MTINMGTLLHYDVCNLWIVWYISTQSSKVRDLRGKKKWLSDCSLKSKSHKSSSSSSDLSWRHVSYSLITFNRFTWYNYHDINPSFSADRLLKTTIKTAKNYKINKSARNAIRVAKSETRTTNNWTQPKIVYMAQSALHVQ